MNIRWIDDDPEYLREVRALFEEYQAELGIDLCFQGFQEELSSLPGRYGAPSGALLILESGDDVIGCGALRDIGGGIAEVKRMMIRPVWRGRGAGRLVLDALIGKAREIGYERVRLDTLRRLIPAVGLYESFGFREIPPYNPNPEPDIVYLERPL